MAKSLVIVESPAKAKTIQKYLGDGYVVESSIGHIRDLPKNAAEVPERLKKHTWARLGLDVDHDFEPIYVVPAEKRSQVAKLRALMKGADQILLATDEDREGEAIAWHLADELKPRVPVKRMVFHEITKSAIQAAIAAPRDIDDNLVQAQEARRALDRLYGYEVSPVLWKKVKPQLSAGRVQSVASRLLVERERERMRFVAAGWWDVDATILAGQNGRDERFAAGLVELGGQRLATGKDFDAATGRLKPDAKVVRLDEAAARALAKSLEGRAFRVASTEEKPYTLRPYAPFMTSTLQQEANRKLGFSAKRAMSTAQRLYEGGYITYMRTDSTNLSDEALSAARAQVKSLYGDAYLHASARTYEKKVKNAQEAHEAIRPAGSTFRTPESLRGELEDDQYRLYDLIWKRTVASQMSDARGRRMQVRVAATATDGREALFAASGKTIDFAGFLRAYVEGTDDPEAALEDREVVLPPLREGQPLTASQLEPKGHETQPPARFTEASLVQALEAAGIGRPSTYASIMQTIQDRGYVFKRGQALVPTLTAFATVGLLETHFGKLVDYGFTAKMESELDEIANGNAQRVPYLQSFYFGRAAAASPDTRLGLKELIGERLESIDPRVVATIPVPRLEGHEIEVRVGRYGPFLKRGEQSVTIPEDIAPDELTLARAEELLSKQSSERLLGNDPATGQPVHAKDGRYGPYVTLGDPASADRASLKYASLFPTDSLATIDLARALQLLSLPRTVGVLEGEEVIAQNGRYGPFIKKGSDTRSLTSHEQLFTVTVEEAAAIFAQPKQRRGQVTAAPLRSFEYEGRAPIVLKQGRFAPYLSDGTLNASLRGSDGPPEQLTAERALDILAERGKPPKAKPGRPVRAVKAKAEPAAKKAAADKPAAKKAPAKKAPAKKSSAKKGAATKAAKEPAAKPPWAEVEPFTRQFDATTAKLLTLVNGEGRKLAEAAQTLGIPAADALARYRASNFKLYASYRQARKGA
jgi:DNA topoisomerase-1